MKNIRVWLPILVLFFIGVAYFSMSDQGARSSTNAHDVTTSQSPLRVVAVLPLTGNASFLGKYIKNGLEVAVRHVNASGGILGRKLEVAYEDSKNDPKQAVTILRRLHGGNKPDVLISAMTGVSKAIIPLATEAHIPLIATTASAAGLPKLSPYAFRLFITASLDAPVMAQFALKQLGKKRFAILAVNDDFGKSYAEIFTREVKGGGAKIVYSGFFGKGEKDFRGLIAQVEKANPDAIYILGYGNNLGVLPMQIREAGLSSTILSIGTIGQPNVLKQAGSALEGAYFTTTLFDPSATTGPGKKFVSDYEQMYGDKPNYFAAFAYDAIGILAHALINHSGDDIKRALIKDRGFKGVMGDIQFDSNGDAKFTMVVKKISQGKIVDAM